MTNYQLQYFVSACELGSFTKAAHMHFVTQAAISQQMVALEKELDVKLFERCNRSIRITKAGQQFYEHAKVVLTQLEQAQRELKFMDYSDSITIGYSGFAERPFLSPWLRRVKKECPELYLNLRREEATGEAFSLLREHKLDGAFVVCDRKPQPGFHMVPLLHYPICLIVGEDHPCAQKKTIREQDLYGLRILRPPLDRDQRKVTMKVSQNHTEELTAPADLTIVDRTEITDHIDTVFHLVEAGDGAAIFPQYYQYAQHMYSSLRFIPLEGDPGNERDLCFVWREGICETQMNTLCDMLAPFLPDEFRVL